MNEWQDKILKEDRETIIECLDFGCHNIFSIEKTGQGYRFVEQCDQYYGVTLNQNQMERFIKELQVLAGVKNK